MKNMMHEYLGSEYTKNPLENFIRYWMKPSVPREENDLDCLYLGGNLYADTIISPWTYVKYVLSVINPDENFYKYNKDSADLYKDLKRIQKNKDKFLPQEKEIVQLLYKFLSLAETRANTMCLPDRRMNNSRYYYYYDQMGPTLYQSFNGGFYYSYFGSEEKLQAWIKEENLDILFNGSISRESIRPLTKTLMPYESKWLTDENEIIEALRENIYFLTQRLDRLKRVEEVA